MVSDKRIAKSGGLHYAFVIVVTLCAIMMVTVGIILQCIGIFVVPVSAGLGTGVGDFLLFTMPMFIVATLILTQATKIVSAFGIKKVMLVSVLINGIILILFSFAGNIIWFWVGGALLGVPIAFVTFYLPPILLNAWFATRVNFWIGVVYAFSGVGGVLFNALGGSLIAESGWQTAYLVLGIVALVVGVVASLFIVDNPSIKNLSPRGEIISADAAAESTQLQGVEKKRAFKSVAFAFLTVFALVFSLGTGFNPLIAGFAQAIGGAVTNATVAATIGTIGAVIAGFALGAINARSVYVGTIFAAGTGVVGAAIFVFLSSMGIEVVYLGAFLLVFSVTAATMHPAVLTAAVFGMKDYGAIWGRVSSFCTAAPIIASTMWGFLLQTTGNYTIVWTVALAVFSISVVSGLLALNQGNRLQKE